MYRILCITLAASGALALGIFLAIGIIGTSEPAKVDVSSTDEPAKVDVIATAEPAKAVVAGTGEPAQPEVIGNGDPATVDVSPLVKGNTQFAFDLYHLLRKQEGNIIFSPFSISCALAMAYAGASGKEVEKMAKALHFSRDAEETHGSFASLKRQLNIVGDPDKFQLSIANALWGQESLSFQKQFLSCIAKHYEGELNLLDISSNPEAARQTINKWIENQTRNMIRNMLSPGSIGANTQLVLANAVYFKARWHKPFPKHQTEEKLFHCTKDKSVPAPMMHERFEMARYYASNEFQLLELPYKGNRFAMLVILPKKVDGLEDLEKSLTPSVLSAAVANLKVHQGEVMIPRYTMTFKISLMNYLATLGIQTEFSGIINGGYLSLNNALHQARIKVNESGTEAAAVTVLDFRDSRTDGPFLSFRADHPFLFLIRDRQTDSILFMGRLVDPSVEKDR